jgi:MFS transporter, NNP family, nitrate/nitrite transporter
MGGASGWVGGLGALGGFLVPPALGFFAESWGAAGYARAFLAFAAMSVICLSVATLLRANALKAETEQGDREGARVA